jgi:glycosyltransferase involved in cell wall biosynthesis
VGGTPELLGKDERGLLFHTGDPVDLAEKLSILVANEQLRRELGVRAADFARAKLNVEIAVSRMADIYEIMLGAKSCVVKQSNNPTRDLR